MPWLVGQLRALRDRGRVYVYYGSVFGLYANTVVKSTPVAAEEAGQRFGFSLAAADFDQDGSAELIVGAPQALATKGRIFVLKGSRTGLAPVSGLSFQGSAAGDLYGFALAAGHWDNGPLASPTLAVGAPGKANNGVRSGMVHILTGSLGSVLGDMIRDWDWSTCGRSAQGGPCSEQNQCADGLSCVDGACGSAREYGEACVTDDECISVRCGKQKQCERAAGDACEESGMPARSVPHARKPSMANSMASGQVAQCAEVAAHDFASRGHRLQSRRNHEASRLLVVLVVVLT